DQRSEPQAQAPKGVAGAAEGIASKETDSALQIDDPVRRAEQAIGAFFEDEEVPSSRFSIDRDHDSGRFVYRLVNSDTGEVMKQFPGDYVLKRVAYYRDLEGLAVDSKA
ncbi:MAG: flagellar protein FlaG, partial [Sneathiella sp.]